MFQCVFKVYDSNKVLISDMKSFRCSLESKEKEFALFKITESFKQISKIIDYLDIHNYEYEYIVYNVIAHDGNNEQVTLSLCVEDDAGNSIY